MTELLKDASSVSVIQFYSDLSQTLASGPVHTIDLQEACALVPSDENCVAKYKVPWENEVGRPNPFCKVGKDSGKILTPELSFKAFTREGRWKNSKQEGQQKQKSDVMKHPHATSYILIRESNYKPLS